MFFLDYYHANKQRSQYKDRERDGKRNWNCMKSDFLSSFELLQATPSFFFFYPPLSKLSNIIGLSRCQFLYSKGWGGWLAVWGVVHSTSTNWNHFVDGSNVRRIRSSCTMYTQNVCTLPNFVSEEESVEILWMLKTFLCLSHYHRCNVVSRIIP